MLRLTTLGITSLVASEEGAVLHPILSQPKRLALLAYLAVDHPDSLAFRDTLLALLWPDYHVAQARHALRQTIYHLRRELGSALVVAADRGGVGVSTERLWCDAVAFERALAAGALEAALPLYRGEFLAGFHAGCGPAFDRWLDAARERLRRKAGAAARTLAERTAARGDVRRGLEYARRAVELAPYDEAAARHLVRLLVASGDRGGAIAAYHGLAARLHDLDLLPEAETVALVAALRTTPHAAAAHRPRHAGVPA